MQRTTRIMFAHYMAHNLALDVRRMRRRRNHILFGNFNFAVVKPYHVYSGDPYTLIGRHLDYPSPLFDRARKHQCRSR